MSALGWIGVGVGAFFVLGAVFFFALANAAARAEDIDEDLLRRARLGDELERERSVL